MLNSPRAVGRFSLAPLLLTTCLVVALPAAVARAQTPDSAAPAAEPHPAISKRLGREQPLPWVFPVFQRGNLTIVDRESRYLLESLFRHARPGSTVRISARRWDRYWNRGADKPLARFPFDRIRGPDCWPPLMEAINRGVDVAVVLNGRRTQDRVVKWLRDPAGPSECPVETAAKRGETRVKICSRPAGERGGGCLAEGEMRADFVSFEHVDVNGVDLHSVVAITGASFNSQQLHQQNDWIVVVGDRRLHNALNDYFEALFSASNDAPETGWKGVASAAGTTGHYDVSGETRSAASDAAGADSALTLSFHPRSDFTQLDALKRVECDSTARIRILMSPPAGTPEGTALIDQASRLGRAGCQVEALLREKSLEESKALIGRLAADNVSVVAVPRISRAFFNSRYLLVDAKIGGKRRRLVYTGGASFDPSPAGSGEELLIQIEDDAVFRAYERQLDQMCRRLNCRMARAG